MLLYLTAWFTLIIAIGGLLYVLRGYIALGVAIVVFVISRFIFMLSKLTFNIGDSLYNYRHVRNCMSNIGESLLNLTYKSLNLGKAVVTTILSTYSE